jgi:hypothetical protein
MSIAAKTYHLVCFRGLAASCVHHALIRVTRPEFGNWSANQESAAEAEQVRKRDVIIDHYRATTLAQDCPRQHEAAVEGEFQGFPEGDVFYASHGQITVDIWVAAYQGRPYWIVFGIAASEVDFWRQVAGDDEIRGIELSRPARRIDAFFITEEDCPRE